MLIDERFDAAGTAIATRLEGAGDRLLLIDGSRRATVPPAAVIAVLRRYGREIDPALLDPDADSLALADSSVVRFRFRAVVDAEVRDYLVLCNTGGPPVAALARDVSAALRFLARDALS
jgi:hypothetical protein